MQNEAVVAYFELLPRHLVEMKETTNQTWWSVTASRFEKRISDHKTSVTAVAILLGSTSLKLAATTSITYRSTGYIHTAIGLTRSGNR
jgi:uncharacterized membrane protein